MRTRTIIEFGDIDLSGKSDSSLSATDIQNFSSANNVKADPIEIKYSTLEKNYFLLDGSFDNMPINVGNVGYWSRTRTNANKQFETPPQLTINFTKDHSSVGLTFRFSEYSYCTHLRITYYDSNNAQIATQDFYPDSYEYFCEGGAVDYRKIIVTFYSTNEANRYLKLYRLQHGGTLTFEGDNLISANIIEELDPLSNELSINTLDFVSFATDDRFNILNPTGIYRTFQETQPIKAYKIAEENLTEMGTFYLESWENESEKSMKIKGIDLIGILDKSEYMGGIYNNVSAVTLIQAILAKANVTNYTITDITEETITGYLPICTCREALQQILFVLGAVADCSRSDAINIYKLAPTQTPNVIEKNQIIKDTKEVKQGEIVTGISVRTHTYKEKLETEPVYEEELSQGTYTIRFENPATNLTIENGTIIEAGYNYAIITATGSGTQSSSRYRGNRNVLISGNTFDDLTSTITITDGKQHDKTNILTIEDCTLINTSNANSVATNVLNYYQSMYENTFDMIMEDEKVGDDVITERTEINQLRGYMTRMDINMTGGFRAKAKVIAKVGEPSG